jgi:hypothetical protein
MLYPQHRAEWLDSCVSPELIDLNVWTIEDAAEADELLNKNTDRRWKHSAIVPGWAVAGISLKTGDRTYQGAQFKPDTPVQVGDRVLKYLSAAGEDSAPLFLDTPNPRYWQGIADDVTRQIILTEGAKKAGAGMTLGEATISIPGVYAGQKKGRLKPQLKPFATLGRRWIIGFDADWRTNRNVYHALDRMARLLASTGGMVLFMDIPAETKGLDDYIAANGEAAFQPLLDAALTYEEWRELCKGIWESQQARQLTAVPDDEEAEIEAEGQKSRAAEIGRLADSVDEQFTIAELLPPALAAPLMQVAARLNVPPAGFLAILLPLCAGRIRVGCELEIDPSTDYRVSPMLWACLLGESGSAKSVMLSLMFKPLLRLQKDADKEHKLREADYRASITEWVKANGEKNGIPKPEEPQAREFYIDDSTMESLADVLTSWPAFGLPLVQDELAGLFNGLNQYKSGGKGSDRQRLLSLYGGGPIKKNRKGARISQERTALSITGTTQPHVLLGLMRGVTEADDGLWARFFWALLPPSVMPPPGGGGRLDIGPMLEALYRKLEEQTPHTFTLDKDAAEEWHQWHLYTENARLKEQHPTLRAIYPKARERAARVALTVHFIEWAMQGKTPADQITGATMAAAVRFTKWTIGQALLIYADAGVAEHGSSGKIAKLVKAKAGMTLSSTEVSTFFGGRLRAAEIKKLMQEAANLGFGTLSKKGKSTRITLSDRNKGSEASEADSIQPLTGTGKKYASPPEETVRRVRRIRSEGDVTTKAPETPKPVETPRASEMPKSEAFSQNASQNASTVRDVQTVTAQGPQEKTPHSPHSPINTEKEGGKNREIKPGDRFVLGGNATAYPKVMAMSSEIFTCTEVSATQIFGFSDSYKDQNFPKTWCHWFPAAAEVV